MTADEKIIKREKEDQKRKETQKQQKQLQEQEAQERRRIAALKLGTAFNVNISDAGHKRIPSYDSQEKLLEAIGSNSVNLDEPFILKKSTTFDDIAGQDVSVAGKGVAGAKVDPKALLKGTLDRWATSFPSSGEAHTQNRVVAPVLAPMGLDAAITAFQKIAPPWVHSRLPSFSAISDSIMLGGAMMDSVHFGYDPSMMASLRWHAAGTAKLLLVSALDAAKYLKEVCGKEVTADSLRSSLQTLTDSEAKACAKRDINIFHGEVTKGEVLYVPVAYVLGTHILAQGKSNQSTLKYSFLPLGSKTKALDVIAAASPGELEMKAIGIVKDALTVYLAEQAAAK